MKPIDKKVQEFNSKLAKCVKKYKVLYDPNNCHYALKHHSTMAWNAVALEMGEDVSVVKSRWRNLKISYLRYLRMSSTPEKKAEVKPYYLLNDISFMEDHVKSFNNSSVKIETKQEESSGNITQEPEDNFVFTISQGGEEEPELKINPVSVAKQNKKEEPAKTVEIIQELRNPIILNKPSTSNNNSQLFLDLSNHDLSFLRSLLPDMQALTPSQKSKFKLSVMTTLNDLLYS